MIVKDIVLQTKSTIGRGSAAASVVSYCLFITQVDPIKYSLSFDRFIHPERINMPDIDIDFPWDERDNILDYVFKKVWKSPNGNGLKPGFSKNLDQQFVKLVKCTGYLMSKLIV